MNKNMTAIVERLDRMEGKIPRTSTGVTVTDDEDEDDFMTEPIEDITGLMELEDLLKQDRKYRKKLVITKFCTVLVLYSRLLCIQQYYFL